MKEDTFIAKLLAKKNICEKLFSFCSKTQVGKVMLFNAIENDVELYFF